MRAQALCPNMGDERMEERESRLKTSELGRERWNREETELTANERGKRERDKGRKKSSMNNAEDAGVKRGRDGEWSCTYCAFLFCTVGAGS